MAAARERRHDPYIRLMLDRARDRPHALRARLGDSTARGSLDTRRTEKKRVFGKIFFRATARAPLVSLFDEHAHDCLEHIATFHDRKMQKNPGKLKERVGASRILDACNLRRILKKWQFQKPISWMPEGDFGPFLEVEREIARIFDFPVVIYFAKTLHQDQCYWR